MRTPWAGSMLTTRYGLLVVRVMLKKILYKGSNMETNKYIEYLNTHKTNDSKLELFRMEIVNKLEALDGVWKTHSYVFEDDHCAKEFSQLYIDTVNLFKKYVNTLIKLTKRTNNVSK